MTTTVSLQLQMWYCPVWTVGRPVSLRVLVWPQARLELLSQATVAQTSLLLPRNAKVDTSSLGADSWRVSVRCLIWNHGDWNHGDWKPPLVTVHVWCWVSWVEVRHTHIFLQWGHLASVLKRSSIHCSGGGERREKNNRETGCCNNTPLASVTSQQSAPKPALMIKYDWFRPEDPPTSLLTKHEMN